MLFRELTTASHQTTSGSDHLGIAQRLCGRHGFITDDRRKATPHIVDVNGLSRTHLTKPGEFDRELSLRLKWCRLYAPDYEVETICAAKGRVGRRFRFRDISIAALFRDTFPTDLTL